METEETKDEQQDALQNIEMEVSRERVESLWRQVLNQKSSARADLAVARASRAKAEMERQRISNEALEATREACRQLIAETEQKLATARQAADDAASKLAEREKELQQAQAERSEAERYRDRVTAEADSYREKVLAETQQEAHRIREEARSGALHECQELKRHVTYEVQSILAEVDSIRAAAQEELEAQRIYSETANLKATTEEVRAQVLGNVNRATEQGSDVYGQSPSPVVAEPQEVMAQGEQGQVSDQPGDGSSSKAKSSK